MAAKLKLKQLRPKVEPIPTKTTITTPKVGVEGINQAIDLGTKPIPKVAWEKDGAEMILIPAGSFEMGNHNTNNSISDALPVHPVGLDAF